MLELKSKMPDDKKLKEEDWPDIGDYKITESLLFHDRDYLSIVNDDFIFFLIDDTEYYEYYIVIGVTKEEVRELKENKIYLKDFLYRDRLYLVKTDYNIESIWEMSAKELEEIVGKDIFPNPNIYLYPPTDPPSLTE